MDFVKLRTRYYADVALMRAGEPAEVLFTRGLAYAGEQETDGFIPAEALPRLTPTRGRARVNALIREGLWEPVLGGWLITGWTRHQISSDQLEQKREAGRKRVEKHRAKKAPSNPVGNAVTNGERCSTEVREKREEDAAAAASRATPPLPPSLEILKTKLDAAKLTARWDRLTAEQHTQIEALIELHGDGPLVKSALLTHRPDSPAAFAQAWLGAWSSLPEPGAGLRLVTDTPCPEPGHSGTNRYCTQCASERLERTHPDTQENR